MIQYTAERRADTGVSNVTMGIWLFLASEVMLFGALFSAYTLVRVSAPSWPSGREILEIRTGLLNTVILVMVTTAAWRGARGALAGAKRSLVIGTTMALVFLIVKGAEYAGEFGRGLAPANNMFLATYFTLTGLHAVHVIGGMVANVWALAGVSRVPEAMTAGRLKALALYWIFVDIVWLVIFGVFYVA